MNENPPPFDPEQPQSTPPPTQYEPPRTPPSFAAMFGLGILLNIVSALLCIPFRSLTPFILGAVGAFISLFFEGYRGISVGFISTVGLILLGTIIYCSTHPFHM